MIDPSVLLSGMLQGGSRSPAMGRLQHATSEQGLGGQDGPLQQILGQSGGGMATDGGRGSGGIGDILSGLGGMNSGQSRKGGGGVLGGIVNAVLGGGSSGGMRNSTGSGALSLLAMVAMNALRSSGQSSRQGAVSDEEAMASSQPSDQATSEATAQLLLRAMIQAAKSDGEIDAEERQRIVAKSEEEGADPEARAHLEHEMDRPVDIEELAAGVDDPVIAGQVYAASLLAIHVDTQAEQDYLRQLANSLRLEPATVSQLHQSLNVPAV